MDAKIYKPILFSKPMVKAILNGSKTQTRRIIKYSKKIKNPQIGFSCFNYHNEFEVRGIHENGAYGSSFFKMKYKVDDILWVRETWQHTRCLNLHPSDDNYGYVYKADDQPWQDYEGWKWKPSIFMPKEACRIFLKVKKVRIERLKDITENDALSEGIETWIDERSGIRKFRDYISGNEIENPDSGPFSSYFNPAIASFRSLWQKINGFDNLISEPWVFVYEFELINISFT